jgi:hypothetical protein
VHRDTDDPTTSRLRTAYCCVAVSLACSFAVALVASGWAKAGVVPKLNRVAYNALRSVTGSYPYTLDCGFAPLRTVPHPAGGRPRPARRRWRCSS